jgi:hypothetical protein
MYLLNLTFLQFVAVFGSISAVAVALYLLDRARRRQVVSTLRFWTAAQQPSVAARRRRVNQPWSLLLQLLSMALLLLAIAQLRVGTPLRAGRDHVVLLDVSSWMAARSAGRTLMDLARDRARRYVRALPPQDRVMLVRADGLATPATAFEPDRAKIEAAISSSQPGATALNLDQALAAARHIQAQSGGRAGEIAFIGTGRVAERDSSTAPPRNLRVILVADAVENCGLRRIGTRRSATDADKWEIFVLARNYGTREHTVTVTLEFGTLQKPGRVPVGAQQVTIPPGAEREVAFEHRTTAAAILGVTLSPRDAFAGDDHAELELPSQPTLNVTVYSKEPELLRPEFAAAPRVHAAFRKPEEYRPDDKGLVILDRFIPPQRPAADSIWLDPPAAGSPVRVRATVEHAAFQKWNPEHVASAGLHTKDFNLDRASVFEAAEGDEKIAEVEAGPVILARPGTPKIVVFGFHPAISALRYELATPILFANLLRWVSPEIFLHSEITGGSVGAVKVVMEGNAPPANVSVITSEGEHLPFTVRDRALNFYTGYPGSVRVLAGDREYVYSLTLPELWDTRWEPPSDTAKGIPRFAILPAGLGDVWPWLALAGALGLALEWFLYGRFRRSPKSTPLLLWRRKSRAAGVRK